MLLLPGSIAKKKVKVKTTVPGCGKPRRCSPIQNKLCQMLQSEKSLSGKADNLRDLFISKYCTMVKRFKNAVHILKSVFPAEIWSVKVQGGQSSSDTQGSNMILPTDAAIQSHLSLLSMHTGICSQGGGHCLRWAASTIKRCEKPGKSVIVIDQ